MHPLAHLTTEPFLHRFDHTTPLWTHQNQGSPAMSSVSPLAVPTSRLFWSSRLPQTMHNCLVYIMHARELGQCSLVSSIAP